MAPRPVSSPAVLLTGFEPFDGARNNPSWLAAQALQGRELRGHRVVSACLPTSFGESVVALRGLLTIHRPVMVVCTGLATNRQVVSLERVAINLNDASIPDNRNNQPIDQPVEPDGPAAYFSTLPLKAMWQRLLADGVPAEISQTAGTFVCNHLFYGLMHALATDPLLRGVRGGFVHVPALETLALPRQVQAVRLLVEAALDHAVDLPLPVGTLS